MAGYTISFPVIWVLGYFWEKCPEISSRYAKNSFLPDTEFSLDIWKVERDDIDPKINSMQRAQAVCDRDKLMLHKKLNFFAEIGMIPAKFLKIAVIKRMPVVFRVNVIANELLGKVQISNNQCPSS